MKGRQKLKIVYAVLLLGCVPLSALSGNEPQISRAALNGLSAFKYRLSGNFCMLRDRTGQDVTYTLGSEAELKLDKGLSTERGTRVKCSHVLLDLKRGDKGEVFAAWTLVR